MSEKPTGGPVRVFPNDLTGHCEIVPEGAVGPVIARINPFSARSESQGWANAHLIAEAFNVHHETGLTPRELAEQRAEMIEALEPFALIAEYDIGADESDGDDYSPMQRHNVAPRVTVGHLRQALAAIAKAKGGEA